MTMLRLDQLETVNPYLWSAVFAWSRLRWDLNPLSWRSRARIRKWKNRFQGQSAVIVCNGPSLLKSDLSSLGDVFTFGLNKINLLFDRSDFRPSAIVAINRFVLQQNADFYNATQIPLFLASEASKSVPMRDNVHFVHVTNFSFARDCSVSVTAGFTVTFAALQLAFHMGFTRVALIGCDHDFAEKGPANAVVTGKGPDRSHFDPRYFAEGTPWQLPDLAASEYYYKMARDAYESHGRMLVNATEGGKLEIFQRMSLADFLRHDR